LGEKRQEAMFILSQLNFGDFLNKPAYSATVKLLGLPLPTDLDTKQVKYSDGEADFILVHHLLGILVGELKSIGRWHLLNNKSEAPDEDVVKRVQKAMKQLSKSKRIVSHIVQDLAPNMTIRATLFLPYVSSAQLLRVLKANPALSKVRTSSVKQITVSFLIFICPLRCD
jgi:hypothetical protein